MYIKLDLIAYHTSMSIYLTFLRSKVGFIYYMKQMLSSLSHSVVVYMTLYALNCFLSITSHIWAYRIVHLRTYNAPFFLINDDLINLSSVRCSSHQYAHLLSAEKKRSKVNDWKNKSKINEWGSEWEIVSEKKSYLNEKKFPFALFVR